MVEEIRKWGFGSKSEAKNLLVLVTRQHPNLKSVGKSKMTRQQNPLALLKEIPKTHFFQVTSTFTHSEHLGATHSETGTL